MRLAASWYPVLQSSELTRTPVALQRFGERLLAWRDIDRTPVVIGECGRRRIPTEADGPRLITAERHGYIWAWWGTEQPLFPLPRVAEVGGGRCPEELPSPAVWPMQFQWHVRASPRIIVANNFDASHLKYIHSVPFESIRRWETEDAGEFIGLRGVALEAVCGGTTELLFPSVAWPQTISRLRELLFHKGFYLASLLSALRLERATLRTQGWPSGVRTEVQINGKTAFVAISTVSPVSERHTIVQATTYVPRTGHLLHDIILCIAYGLETKLAGMEDVPIWNAISPEIEGVYVREDRAVLEFFKLYDRYCGKVDPAWVQARRSRGATSSDPQQGLADARPIESGV